MAENDKSQLPAKMKRRPRSFESAEELEKLIREYFAKWEEAKRPITVVGMACYLDVTRETLNQYGTGKYDTEVNDFSDTIKKAKEYIETHKWEKGLTGEYNTAMAIFDLKSNHGASDKALELELKQKEKDAAASAQEAEKEEREEAKEYITAEEAARAYQEALKATQAKPIV